VALHSRWSATLLNEDGRWILVSFSASTNAFNNEVITLYLRSWIIGAVAIAGAVALVAGFILGALLW